MIIPSPPRRGLGTAIAACGATVISPGTAARFVGLVYLGDELKAAGEEPHRGDEETDIRNEVKP